MKMSYFGVSVKERLTGKHLELYCNFYVVFNKLHVETLYCRDSMETLAISSCEKIYIQYDWNLGAVSLR